MVWKLEFKPNWDKYFCKFDNSVQNKIIKKLDKMKEDLKIRRLHSSEYDIKEVGQYRIAFINDFKNKIRKIYFIGNHKQYEDWYKISNL